jgi:hypothetical protein
MPRFSWENKFTIGNAIQVVLLLATLISLYFGVVGRLEAQGKDIIELQATVSQVPSLAQHVAIIDNTMTINKAARDKSMDAMSDRLDTLTATVNVLAQNVAALTATIKAREDVRP